eukprot:GHVU01234224.1.p3 GENE.GHVU01234224.1~~GHVU01234224.1.p3  ORF type:complete len:122 (-),score=2.37 GHVU01234224.1:418-783(-)
MPVATVAGISVASVVSLSLPVSLCLSLSLSVSLCLFVSLCLSLSLSLSVSLSLCLSLSLSVSLYLSLSRAAPSVVVVVTEGVVPIVAAMASGIAWAGRHPDIVAVFGRLLLHREFVINVRP